MIAFLRGRILDKQPNLLIVDVQGVGYLVHVPSPRSTMLASVVPKPHCIFTRTSAKRRSSSTDF